MDLMTLILSVVLVVSILLLIYAHKRIDKLNKMCDFHSEYIDATSTLALKLNDNVVEIQTIFNEAAKKLDEEKGERVE